MVYRLPFVHALTMLMLVNAQLFGGWQSPEEKRLALEVRGLHVNDAPVEYSLLQADIYDLPIRYTIGSELDQHAVWQGRMQCDNESPIWPDEKSRHKLFTEGQFTFKQCTIGQLLNTNPDPMPDIHRLPKRFFWETCAYAFGSPLIFLSGAAIFSAYLSKDVPLQKWAYVTAALGGLWAAWGLFDSCCIDSNSKYHSAINTKDNALRESVKYFDPKVWLARSLPKTGLFNLAPEQTASASNQETEFYKPVYESLKSNQQNIVLAINALPVPSYEFMAKQFYAEVKKQEDIAFMLGGGSVAALALLLAARTGK